MRKKKCLATLSGILLAITIIAPFSFLNTYALVRGVEIYTVFSFNRGTSRTIEYEDIYIVAGGTMNNYKVTININNNFVNDSPGNMPYTWGVIETDGEFNVVRTDYTSGTRKRYVIELTLNNATYCHFQVSNYGPNDFWDVHQAAPAIGMAVTIDKPSTYSLGETASNSYYLRQILTAIQNGGSGGTIADLSVLEDLAQDILDSSLESNENEETIIQMLEDIQELLATQPNSPTQDVIDNNDQANQDAQDVIEDYDTLTSTFDSDFDDSQTEMNTIMQNTTLTQFTDAAVWFTQQLGFLYNSLGDMKILVAMPLILGIALFFIGRGNVIFREGKSTLTYQEITDLDTLETKERIIHNTSSRYSKRQQKKAQKWVDDNF